MSEPVEFVEPLPGAAEAVVPGAPVAPAETAGAAA